MAAYLVAENEVTNPGRVRALPGGGRRHPRTIWRPLPGPGRRDRTDRRRAGAETGHHPRIRRHRGGQALIQFAGIPENPAKPARQLDRPPLRRRGHKLNSRINVGRAAVGRKPPTPHRRRYWLAAGPGGLAGALRALLRHSGLAGATPAFHARDRAATTKDTPALAEQNYPCVA
jgi:hypothetical protein